MGRSPPDDPPSVGGPAAATVRFSEPGWTLAAGFPVPDQDCTREFHVPLAQTDDGGWTLDPAGTYDVNLFAQGAGGRGGDAVATFTWTTPVRGASPAPEADLTTDFVEPSTSRCRPSPAELSNPDLSEPG